VWYDGAMTESKSEKSEKSEKSGEGISDDQLPDDLNPDKNPLADPEEKGAASGNSDSDDSDGGDKPAEGMPDMGQPG
jgi:hypothetical protein